MHPVELRSVLPRLIVATVAAFAAAAAPAAAAPVLAVTESCAYAGHPFAIAGGGFAARAELAVEVMATPDPLAGAPLARRVLRADERGLFVATLDVPPAASVGTVVRSVRVRPASDGGPTPDVLASAGLLTATRGARVRDRGARSTAAATQRWRLTGLPEGTALFAHYRHGGRTVARRALGVATDPCGRLSFALRALPRGHERAGDWQLWITADRRFRRPRRGVYVRRALRSDGASPRARVRAGEPLARLLPLDPRLRAPVTNGMAADASQIGLITLIFVGARGGVVEFAERVGDRLIRLGTSRSAPGEILTTLAGATAWSCRRSERRFLASTTRPGGELAIATYGVRTPSCAGRFRLSAPRRVARGRLARVRIADRWALGAIAPRLCVTPPGARRTCRPVRFARAVSVVSRRFRATRGGDWRVELRVGDRRVRSAVVRAGGRGSAAPRRLPTVLATGDSTMQGIDGFLADELAERASVVSDVRIGSALSRSGQEALPGARDPSAVQWALLAAQQSARRRQRVTVVSLGAAEGLPMTTVEGREVACCATSWAREYARRARLVMDAHARGGRAPALWLTLPLPRDERRQVITRTVNGAIVEAAAGARAVRVLRLDLLFTPDGYREVVRHRGRDVDVRDVDGIHLNVAGTAIAARAVARELRPLLR